MPQTHIGNTVVRKLSGVLASSDESSPEFRGYFYQEPLLRDHLRDRDHVLYEAERDVVPSSDAVDLDGSWRVDRVVYPGADLPTGELNRSTGHWNPADQWEIFEVECGEIVLLVRMPGPDKPVELIHCGQGHVVVLEPGAWHLTYVPGESATVCNAYFTPSQQPSHPGGEREDKYFTRPTVRYGLRRGDDGEGYVVFRDGTDPERPPLLRSTAKPRQEALPGMPSLVSLFGDERDANAVGMFERYCTGAGQRG